MEAFNKGIIVKAITAAFDAVETAKHNQSDAGKAFRATATSLWTQTCKHLSIVPVDQLDGVCAEIREPQREKTAFKTLTNSLSTASSALKLGVSLYSEKGETLARGKVESASAAKRLETPEGRAAAESAKAAAEAVKAAEVRNYDMHDIANVLKLCLDPILAMQFSVDIHAAHGVVIKAAKAAQAAQAAVAKTAAKTAEIRELIAA